jgi:hypothetical protein
VGRRGEGRDSGASSPKNVASVKLAPRALSNVSPRRRDAKDVHTEERVDVVTVDDQDVVEF